MKKLIWKIIYKIIERWRRVAKRNRLDEQELDCIRILVGLEMYRKHMQEKRDLVKEKKKMKKALMIISVMLALSAVFVGCDEQSIAHAGEEDVKIKLLYNGGGNHGMYIFDFEDPETGVHYLIYRDENCENGGITVRYDGMNRYREGNALYID